MYFLFFKQKTAYEMRISDWSSDVCSSDLHRPVKLAVRIARQFGAPDDPLRLHEGGQFPAQRMDQAVFGLRFRQPRSRAGDQMDRLPQPFIGNAKGGAFEIGRASRRERVCQYV